MSHRGTRFSAGMLAILLCTLVACAPPEYLRELPPSQKQTMVSPFMPQPTATPAPTPTGPVWEEGRQLGVELPDMEPGALELPIYGATGYATVNLGLWSEKPSKPLQTPVPSAPPSAEPSPEQSPPPTPTPAPDSPPVETPALPPEVTLPPTESLVPEATPEAPGEEALPPATAALLSAVSSVPPEPTPTPDPFAGAMAVLPAGSAFTVLEESGDWWRVKSAAGTGWVCHTFAMINLPDVVPSIVYDATNSYDSRYTTSGHQLPGITGNGLYTGKVYNPRFDEEQYLMPVLYAMAKRVCAAQQNALAQGNSLKLYEGYRPYAVQKAVLDGVSTLAAGDPEIKAGVSAEPWGVQWFISTGFSNHQRGYAIDVSLVKVTEIRSVRWSGHTYVKVDSYEEYTMPTPIHELSIAAVTFTAPVPVYSQTAWKTATLSAGMNPPALGLQAYCTDAGLTPLASEWWHFNDVNAYQKIQSNLGTGNFEINVCVSLEP